MPTRPESPDPSRSTAGAEGAYAGLNFFQDWMKAASSALPHLTGASRAGSHAWTLPTLDPEELDKRIQDLKTVQFWLEQNARMIGMTIQTLEVQRMTLNTLRSMNMPMDAVRDSLKASPPDRAASAAAARPEPLAQAAEATEASAPGAEGATANPLQWWNTLTTQFTQLAQQAVQAGQDAVAAATPSAPTAGTSNAPRRTTGQASTAPKAGKTTSVRAAKKSSPARKRGTTDDSN